MTPTQRNNAPEINPCDIICTIAPSMPMPAPFTAPVRRHDVLHEERAERHEAHVRDRGIRDQLLHVLLHERDEADVDHGDQRQARSAASRTRALASGVIGRLNRSKP